MGYAFQNESLSRPQFCVSANKGRLFFSDLSETSVSCHNVPRNSVIKVWDVVVGVSTVTLRGVVGNAQVVESWEEDQDSYDEDRDGAVTVL